MDKELLEKLKACKTAEEIRALMGSKRQLNEGELEEVVGGASGGCPADYKVMGYTADEFAEYLQAIVNEFGIDVAVEVANKWIQTNDWKKYMSSGGKGEEAYYACRRIWNTVYIMNE